MWSVPFRFSLNDFDNRTTKFVGSIRTMSNLVSHVIVHFYLDRTPLNEKRIVVIVARYIAPNVCKTQCLPAHWVVRRLCVMYAIHSWINMWPRTLAPAFRIPPPVPKSESARQMLTSTVPITPTPLRVSQAKPKRNPVQILRIAAETKSAWIWTTKLHEFYLPPLTSAVIHLFPVSHSFTYIRIQGESIYLSFFYCKLISLTL